MKNKIFKIDGGVMEFECPECARIYDNPGSCPDCSLELIAADGDEEEKPKPYFPEDELKEAKLAEELDEDLPEGLKNELNEYEDNERYEEV